MENGKFVKISQKYPQKSHFWKKPRLSFFFIQIYLKLNNMNEKGGQMDQKRWSWG